MVNSVISSFVCLGLLAAPPAKRGKNSSNKGAYTKNVVKQAKDVYKNIVCNAWDSDGIRDEETAEIMRPVYGAKTTGYGKTISDLIDGYGKFLGKRIIPFGFEVEGESNQLISIFAEAKKNYRPGAITPFHSFEKNGLVITIGAENPNFEDYFKLIDFIGSRAEGRIEGKVDVIWVELIPERIEWGSISADFQPKIKIFVSGKGNRGTKTFDCVVPRYFFNAEKLRVEIAKMLFKIEPKDPTSTF